MWQFADIICTYVIQNQIEACTSEATSSGPQIEIEKHKLQCVKKEIEEKHQLLEQKRDLEEASLEKSIWQQVVKEKAANRRKVHDKLVIPHACDTRDRDRVVNEMGQDLTKGTLWH